MDRPTDSSDRSPAGAPDLRVSVVCSGNICRSPIGAVVLRAALAEAGLGHRVEVTSAGIGDWHVGQPANPRAVRVLRAAGYLDTDHVAHQITSDEIAGLDLVLAADRGHLKALRRLADDPAKVRLLRSFDPAADADEVPDPYYGPDSGFDDVLTMTQAAVPGVVEEIRGRLDEAPTPGRPSRGP